VKSKTTTTKSTTTLVEMGQYYSCEFTGDEMVATCDVSSCVVLVVKNFRETEPGKKECSHLALGHFNVNQLWYQDTATENVLSMFKDFQEKGGAIDENTSFTILGGVDPDENKVRGRLKEILENIKKTSFDIPEIKEPKGYTVKKEIFDKGGSSGMTILVDKYGTNIRKVESEKEGAKKSSKTEFYPPERAGKLLSDANYLNVIPFDESKWRQAKEKSFKFRDLFSKAKEAPGEELLQVLKNFTRMENRGEISRSLG
jgi:hypothetical protein